jgi:hypothetical protein
MRGKLRIVERSWCPPQKATFPVFGGIKVVATASPNATAENPEVGISH